MLQSMSSALAAFQASLRLGVRDFYILSSWLIRGGKPYIGEERVLTQLKPNLSGKPLYLVVALLMLYHRPAQSKSALITHFLSFKG